MRLEGVGVDDGGDGVGGVVESVDELEAEGDEEGDAEENIRHDRSAVDGGEIGEEMEGGVDDADDQDDAEADHADFAGTLAELVVDRGSWGHG